MRHGPLFFWMLVYGYWLFIVASWFVLMFMCYALGVSASRRRVGYVGFTLCMALLGLMGWVTPDVRLRTKPPACERAVFTHTYQANGDADYWVVREDQVACPGPDGWVIVE